ncbi:MAG: hypothetical protein PHH70_01840 [Candidatus Gracilibacteria bacterium]|nr:hypothetical protein [Candidatus Gracilibacteria bacterium]
MRTYTKIQKSDTVSRENPGASASTNGLGHITRTATFAAMFLAGCGGGGGGNAPQDPLGAPIGGSVFSGKGMIELGPVSGATIEIRTLGGELVTTGTTGPDGTFSYTIPENKRVLLSQNDFFIAEGAKGIDTNSEDTTDMSTATSKPVNGTIRGLVPSEVLTSGKLFRINPMNAQVTASLLKSGGAITTEQLNTATRALGAIDTDGNGVVDYRDLLVHPMTQANPAKDATQSFLATIHSGDTVTQEHILEQAQIRQNLATMDLTPGTYGQPSVELKKSSAAVKIIYTLDGSIPEVGSGTSRDYISGSKFSYQNAELNYREVFLINGRYEAGENKTFHLQHDPATWSEENQEISANVSNAQTAETPIIYENGQYTIVTQYNIENNSRKYPGLIWVRIAPKSGYTGQARGIRELVTYSASYEQTLRTALIEATQNEIILQKYTKSATPVPVPTPTPTPTPKPDTTPTHPQNSQENAYPHESYKNGWVEVTNQWNLDGKSDYPVKVIGSYSLPIAGRKPNKEALARNVQELTALKNQFVQQMKAEIDAEVNAQPRSNYSQNQLIETNNTSYRGGHYRLKTIMNLNGNADFPAKVTGIYALPGKSEQPTVIIYAYNTAELTRVQADQIAQMRAEIDKSIDDKYPAGYTQVISSNVPYNKGTYTVTFNYSSNPGADYPGTIIINYTLPTGVSSNWSLTADNENEKNKGLVEGVNSVKAQIDLNQPLPPATHTPGQVTHTDYTAYHVGDYTVYAQYNYEGKNTDYPAKVWGEYHKYAGKDLWTTGGHIVVQNEIEKENVKAQLIAQMKADMPVHVVNDEVKSETFFYGRGYYRYTTTYNRKGNDQDYPAIIVVTYYLPGYTWERTAPQMEVFSEADFTQKVLNLHTNMRQIIDSKQTALNSFSTSAETQFANLVKSIQFLPSAIAGGSTVASTRNDVAVKVDKSLLPCKYPTSATKVTSDGNSIFLIRGQYQFIPGVSILAKMQYDMSIPAEQVCRDVEKGVEKKILSQEIFSAFNSLKAEREAYYVNGDQIGGYRYKNPEIADQKAQILAQKLIEYNLLTNPNFKKKYDDLMIAQSHGNPNLQADIARGVKDGMIKAVKEYIAGYTNLLDLNLVQIVSVTKELGNAAIDMVNNGLDINKIAYQTSEKLTEAYDILNKLPDAITSLGVYEKSLFSTYIGTYIGIEVFDPLKKVGVLVKGFEFPGMAMAQFVVGKAYIGDKAKSLDEVSHFMEWNRLASNKRIVATLDNIPSDIRNAAKLGSAKLISLTGHEYSFNPEKIKQHMKNSGKYITGKSYFLESMSENDVYNLTMEVMNKLDDTQWKDIIANTKDVKIDLGRVIGMTQLKKDEPFIRITSVTIRAKSNGLMHIFPDAR